MFFPIRCMFWLSIVFTTIYSQDQAGRHGAPVTGIPQAVEGAVARAVERVESRVAEHCANQPSECIGTMAKLAAAAKPEMARPDIAKLNITAKPETLRTEDVKEPRMASGATTTTVVPLPPPRPGNQALGTPERASSLGKLFARPAQGSATGTRTAKAE
jgi:hypothetical protein